MKIKQKYIKYFLRLVTILLLALLLFVSLNDVNTYGIIGEPPTGYRIITWFIGILIACTFIILIFLSAFICIGMILAEFWKWIWSK